MPLAAQLWQAPAQLLPLRRAVIVAHLRCCHLYVDSPCLYAAAQASGGSGTALIALAAHWGGTGPQSDAIAQAAGWTWWA